MNTVFNISPYFIGLSTFLDTLAASSTPSRFATARSSLLNIDTRAIRKV